jgi:hypothetical protein
MDAHDEHTDDESAWRTHFSPEQREEQEQVDRDAWNGIIGLLLAIVIMGVTMGVAVVTAITFLT